MINELHQQIFILMGQKRPISLAFVVKDERNNIVREVKDATGIPHKTLDLMLKDFDYLYE